MSEIQDRLQVINAKIQDELITRSRLKDAMAKAIVVVWMGAAVFFGFMLSESQFKSSTLDQQESSYVSR